MSQIVSECSTACSPDCNQYQVLGCDSINPAKTECRSDGDCRGALWDWSCCVGASETGGNTTPIGLHDKFDGMRGVGDCRVTGWTTDTDDPQIDVNYRVLVDKKSIITGVSDTYQENLLGICSQGTCAFDRNIYSLIDKNYEHQVRVESRDVQTNSWVSLDGTPKSLTCSNLICTINGPTTICPGSNSTYSVRAAGTGLSATGIYVHTASGSAGLRTVICTGGDSCTGNITLPTGVYFVYCNAQTPNAPPNARCTGNPFCLNELLKSDPDVSSCANWVDCGASDMVEVKVDDSACSLPP